MASILAAQLDELMGRDRNLAPNEKSKKTHWSDEMICKHYLVEFCPYDVFINTKFDLGYCEKIHDEPLRIKYQQSERFQKMGYEEDFLKFLEDTITDVERKIKRGHARLAVNDSQNNIKIQQLTKDNDEKITTIQIKVDDLLKKVEDLGSAGNVEEAQETIKEVEKLSFERDRLKLESDTAKAMERHMKVCDVCGAFLIVNDAPSRIDDHNSGKQHLGFIKVREAAQRIKEKLYGNPKVRSANPGANAVSSNAPSDTFGVPRDTLSSTKPNGSSGERSNQGVVDMFNGDGTGPDTKKSSRSRHHRSTHGEGAAKKSKHKHHHHHKSSSSRHGHGTDVDPGKKSKGTKRTGSKDRPSGPDKRQAASHFF